MRVIAQVRELLVQDYPAGETLYLAGESAYVTLDQNSPVFEDMVVQAPRPAGFRLASDGGSIYVGVPSGLVAEAQAQTKTKFYLMLDVYLHYMRKIRGDFLFIGGAATDSDTNLEFFLVNDGKVVRVADKRLPHMKSSDFNAQFLLALNDVLGDQGTEETKIYWAYPLELSESLESAYGLISVPLERLTPSRLRLRAISTGDGKESQLKAFIPSVAGLILGGAIAACLIGYQWLGYTKAQARYVEAVAPVESVYVQGAAMLQTLTSQQRMLDAPPAQEVLTKHWMNLAAAAMKSGSEVVRISVMGEGAKGSGLGGRSVDFEMDLTVPADYRVADRVFAKQLLTRLAEHSGYEMWLRPGEVRTTDGVRTIEIEGVWNVQ
jgi:hypothetical protein